MLRSSGRSVASRIGLRRASGGLCLRLGLCLLLQLRLRLHL